MAWKKYHNVLYIYRLYVYKYTYTHINIHVLLALKSILYCVLKYVMMSKQHVMMTTPCYPMQLDHGTLIDLPAGCQPKHMLIQPFPPFSMISLVNK